MRKQFFIYAGKIIFAIICFLNIFIWIVGGALLDWYSNTFGVTFREIIYTIKSPLKGADTHFLKNALIFCLPAIFVVLTLLFVCLCVHEILKYVSFQIYIRNIEIGMKRGLSILYAFCFLGSIIGAATVLMRADEKLQVSAFVKSRLNQTTIYDDYYVSPDIETIYADNPKNLIHIYLESMETTYASKDVGGSQPEINYIPKLTDLAFDNISFSNGEKLGGFHNCAGAGWTVVAMFSSESGIPFSFPIAGNDDFGNRESFAKGVITLGDILEKKGYHQEFLCGSDATFAGRRALYEQHGNYDIFDWYSAIEAGYVTQEDYVWWGLEDKNLYKVAKDELTRLSELGGHFNLTMLTVDTHHVDGWVCDLCGDEYPEQLGNVVKCADNQISSFLDWCKEQSWYEDTVIVIHGDHPRMDTSLVEGVDGYDRTVYNCIINASNVENARTTNREFVALDLFPTILHAMGFEITGGRLGLGTDLFSDQDTLTEEMGFEYFNRELGKYSDFYIENFS